MEKKSERLEVRLGYKEKEAFTETCETQGDTPSGAITAMSAGLIVMYFRKLGANLYQGVDENLQPLQS